MKASLVTLADKGVKSTRVLPVAETIGVTLGVAANHGDKGEEEEHEEENDFATRQPKLGLTITTDSKEVQSTVAGNDTNANTNGWARGRNDGAPVRSNKSQSGDLKGDEERLIKEEVPPRHKTHSIVNKVASQTNKTARDRVQSNHLGYGVVDQSEDARIEEEGEEETGRTTLGKASTNTDEESGTNGTTNGNQLDLAVVEATMQTVGIVGNVNLVHVGGRPRHLHLGVFFIVANRHDCG